MFVRFFFVPLRSLMKAQILRTFLCEFWTHHLCLWLITYACDSSLVPVTRHWIKMNKWDSSIFGWESETFILQGSLLMVPWHYPYMARICFILQGPLLMVHWPYPYMARICFILQGFLLMVPWHYPYMARICFILQGSLLMVPWHYPYMARICFILQGSLLMVPWHYPYMARICFFLNIRWPKKN